MTCGASLWSPEENKYIDIPAGFVASCETEAGLLPNAVCGRKDILMYYKPKLKIEKF